MQIAEQRGEIPVIWGIHRQIRNNEMLFKFESAKGPITMEIHGYIHARSFGLVRAYVSNTGGPEVKTRGHLRLLTNFDIRRMGGMAAKIVRLL